MSTVSLPQEITSNYNLNPKMDLEVEKYFQFRTNSSNLLKQARDAYDLDPEECDPDLDKKQFKVIQNHVFGNSLKTLIDQKEHFVSNNYTKDELIKLFKIVLEPGLDQAIRDYFKSYYAIIWFGFREVKDLSDNVSARWHCDHGPKEHLKTITYLTSSEDHQSTTWTMSTETTDRLKEAGYIFCDVKDRKGDINDLLAALEINEKPASNQLFSGDTILFNPFKVAHKAGLPEEGKARECFDFCILPSLIPWDEVIQRGALPANGCVGFDEWFDVLLNIAPEKRSSRTNIDTPNNEQPPEITKELKEEKILLVDSRGSIQGMEMLKHILNLVFQDENYAALISQRMYEASQGNLSFSDPVSLIRSIKLSFHSDIKWDNVFSPADRQRLIKALEFEEKFYNSTLQYRLENKPNKDAVFWPIPNHPNHPKNKYDMLPFVKKHEIMDKSTPVGSAGSCFAFEIAKELQKEDFNYLVSERADDPTKGVIVDGYTPGDKYAKFSANYGILFNTPSLYQLAEKAFSLREFNPYLVRLDNGYYMDPYRENVFFNSIKSFKNDYPNHIAAIRNSLLNSEVFIFTAGLNECWEMDDGTVISRNPRQGFFHMIHHKILTVEENVKHMSNFFIEVKKRNPKFKMVLTLSPIPLLATGRAETHHIIEANTHSKAVLRVAIDEVVKKFDDVYYLPSYELVTECIESPWIEDHRHVSPETISKVIGMFKQIFCK